MSISRNSQNPSSLTPTLAERSVKKGSPLNRSATLARLAQEVQQLESAARRPTSTSAVSSGCTAMDACLPENGYVPGTIIEYLRTTSGCGATYLALAAAASALRAAEEKYLVIVDTHHQLYPPALLSHRIPLAKVIWVRPQSQADAIWSVDQALRTPAVAAVIADLEAIDERDARRLQLAAERGGGLGLLLRSLHARRMPSWAEVQWVVRSAIPSAGKLQSTAPLATSLVQATTSTPHHLGSRQSLRRLEVGLARVRGGKAGLQLLLDIDAATGTLQLVAREKNSHERSAEQRAQSTSPAPIRRDSQAPGPLRAGQTSAVHLASQLANSATTSQRTATG